MKYSFARFEINYLRTEQSALDVRLSLSYLTSSRRRLLPTARYTMTGFRAIAISK